MVTNKSILIIGGVAILAFLILQIFRGENMLFPNARLSQTPASIQKVEDSCVKYSGEVWDFAEAQLKIGDKVIPVAVADTSDERTRGLGGCEKIPDGAGMYFMLDAVTTPTFWMKDTLVALDMVWIHEGVVVDITENVQPQPGATDEDLVRYSPDVVVDTVLELPGGSVELFGIQEGDTIEL